MGLFSTTNNYHRTEHVPYEKNVTVNEYRATTDESVRLLNEFQEKARKNIIYQAKIEDNILNAYVIYYKDDYFTRRMQFDIKFSINGYEVLISDYVDNFEWRDELSKIYNGFGNKTIFDLFYKSVSEVIAYYLINNSHELVKSLEDKYHV